MLAKRYIINVQGAIYQDDRYLLGKRSQAETYMPGELGLPGGKIDLVDEIADDVILATLKREILEEVNVHVSDCHLLITRYFEAEGDPVLNLVYLCRYQSGEPIALDPDEVETVHWMTLDEALQNPNCREWTHLYLKKAEALRQKLHSKG